MDTNYKQDLQDWQTNPSAKAYAKLHEDVDNFSGSKDSQETALILEIMYELLEGYSDSFQDEYENEDEDEGGDSFEKEMEGVYQLCLDKFEGIPFPLKEDPLYQEIIDKSIKLLALFKQNEDEIDEDQLDSVLYSVIESFKVDRDNLSANKLYETLKVEAGEDWLMDNAPLVGLFLDIAIETGDDNLGIEASYQIDDYELMNTLSFKPYIFRHVDGSEHISDTIRSARRFFKLFKFLKHTDYYYVLIDVLSEFPYYKEFKYKSHPDFIPWLYEAFKVSKKYNDIAREASIIVFALRHIQFNPRENEIDKKFSFDILKGVVKWHELTMFEALRKTNKEQYLTNDNLSYLKENIDNCSRWADEAAKTLLTKPRYKKFIKLPISSFLEVISKESSNSISDNPVSETSEIKEKIEPKPSNSKKTLTEAYTSTKAKSPSSKTPYRPKGVKRHFYGLYKLIHGKKK